MAHHPTGTQLNWRALYAQALAIRSFEYAAARAFDAGHIPGLLHLAIGQEVLASLLACFLNADLDRLTTSHRCHALALALGVHPQDIAHELMGLDTGLSAGRGGTQHLIGKAGAFMASNGIVGAPLPLALGAALAAKHKATGGIGVCVIGDGAFNQGVVSESLNIASSTGLPILIIIDNNGKAQDTDTTTVTGGSIIGRARAFGLAAEKTDSSAPEQLAEILARTIAYVRDSQMPCLIEIERPALGGHFHGHGSHGLPALEDLAQAGQSPAYAADPLAVLAQYVIRYHPELLADHNNLIAEFTRQASSYFALPQSGASV